ncbi:MAG: DUF3160 domain-containing protein [Anaerolineae bacterium]|nr:DUF3160 domain-containing protein [Anaerolineae bacterium]
MLLWQRALVFVLALSLIGCSVQPTATPLPTLEHPQPTYTFVQTATPDIMMSIPRVKGEGFAQMVEEEVQVVPQVPEYSFDPHETLNAELARRFSPAQLAFLKENGFVIVPEGPAQIYDIYKRAKEVGIPPFVTTDAFLHAYHILYDYTLRDVEYEFLVHDLELLLTGLLEATKKQVEVLSAWPSLQEAARKNLAFLAVARCLLVPESSVPDEVADLVEKELALISAHKGFARSPIFQYIEDYSQYVPRGHYTRNETFERYFRSMMWLGRMSFRLRPGKNQKAIEMGRRETRQALLLVMLLANEEIDGQSALELWERIYEPTVFFVGKTDDLNVYDYLQVVENLYGSKFKLSLLADDSQIDNFIEKALQLRPPKIVSGYVTDQEDASQVTKGFRFMGQRFVPDSYIFQQLVYGQVGRYRGKDKPFTMELSDGGAIRAFPRGLDVAAVLGSDRALEILREEGDTDYENYDEQMAKLRKEFASLPASQWHENLYWGWLHVLRPLLEEKEDGYPAFMRRTAWLDKGLLTFLGSWAELRHDTILYVKQSYTLRATGLLPHPKRLGGYVEPDLKVWQRLLSLVRQTKEGLASRGILGEEFSRKFELMEKLVSQVIEISRKELENKPLNETDVSFLENIGAALEEVTTFSEELEGKLTSKADERMAIVADVHTDTNSGRVLEEGVGDPFTIYVIVPQQGETLISVGGVFSYYEFKQPMDQRLTDEEWQAMDPKPPLAPWLASLVQE